MGAGHVSEEKLKFVQSAVRVVEVLTAIRNLELFARTRRRSLLCCVFFMQDNGMMSPSQIPRGIHMKGISYRRPISESVQD